MLPNKAGKKLINTLDSAVDDFIEGFLYTHPTLRQLEGHRIIVRGDLNDFDSEKVAVIGGGPAGHEPCDIGFIGKNMLTGAVIGDLFTSPSVETILTAIRYLSGSAGVLLIVKNNLDDVANFMRAYEIAKEEEINIQVLYVKDDSSTTESGRKKDKRGVAGAVLVYKIAGSVSERFHSLIHTYMAAMKHSTEIGTISIGLTASSLPGQMPTFNIAENHMSIAPGIQGEPGMATALLKPAKEIVRLMLDHLTSQESKYHLPIDKATVDGLGVLINNLGGLSVLELYVVAKETYEYFHERGYYVDRAFVGTFMTAFDMVGFSITVMHLYEGTLTSYDLPTPSPYWIMQAFPPPIPEEFKPPGPEPQVTSYFKSKSRLWKFLPDPFGPSRPAVPHPAIVTTTIVPYQKDLSSNVDGELKFTEQNVAIMGVDGTKCMYQVLLEMIDEIIDNEDLLNDLDKARGGHGNYGTIMVLFARATLQKVGLLHSTKLFLNCPYKMLLTMAYIAEKSMRGICGKLYYTFLTAAATPLQSSVGPMDWCNALETGIAAIERYGAESGESTMIDPLQAACQVLKELLPKTATKIALVQAVKAAQVAAEGTADKNEYFEYSRKAKPDPGAIAVALWMKAILYEYKRYGK